MLQGLLTNLVAPYLHFAQLYHKNTIRPDHGQVLKQNYLHISQ